jgi:phosphonatase-like hydrolase
MKRFDLVVLDMAGTTIRDDGKITWSFIEAFQREGIRVAESEVAPLMGYKKVIAIQKLLQNEGLQASVALIDRIHDQFESLLALHYAEGPLPEALPEVIETFEKIKSLGISIALNTGFTKKIADILMHRLQWTVRDLIQAYIASDEVVEGRPAPYMIQAMMERFQVSDSRRVVKVGDTEVDINEGFQAQCGLVVAVTTGAFTYDELLPFKPHIILDSLKNLPDLLIDGRGQ